MGECSFAQGDDARMLATLTDPAVVTTHALPSGWKVAAVLEQAALPTMALLTMAPLTMDIITTLAVLTMAVLTIIILTMVWRPYSSRWRRNGLQCNARRKLGRTPQPAQDLMKPTHRLGALPDAMKPVRVDRGKNLSIVTEKFDPSPHPSTYGLKGSR